MLIPSVLESMVLLIIGCVFLVNNSFLTNYLPVYLQFRLKVSDVVDVLEHLFAHPADCLISSRSKVKLRHVSKDV